MLRSTKPDVLYHFTCRHGRKDIGTFNCLLLPHLHPMLGCKVLWLTPESNPDRRKVGLTMTFQPCDRMQFRYVVNGTDLEHCRPWLDSAERQHMDASYLAQIEVDGAPEQWWIANRPIRARFDRSWST